jgi:hypothetical protein
VPIDRRGFCLTVAGTLAAACSTAPAEPPRQGLARLLALKGSEESWLDALSPAEQRDLHEALGHPSQQTSRRTVDLVMKVLGRRERLFAYVGYPELPQLGACDGLIRE